MKQIFFIALFLAYASQSMAQLLRIEGKVIDDSTGLAVAGATVQVKGGRASQTKSDGYFSILSANANPILLITALGYRADTVRIVNKSNGTVVRLVSIITLMQEVKVSTGYQQLSPEKSTGSFEVIDNRLLNRGVSNDILSRLEAVTSGFFVDHSRSTPGFYLRGLSTLRGDTQPLIILDNFPYEGNIYDIDPDNIENVTVLRDAGAASIWGAKAANCVIVLTTKKGKYNQQKNISLAMNVNIEKKPDLFASARFMSSADFMGVEKFLFDKGYYDADLADRFYYPVISPLVELLAKQRAGNASQQDVDVATADWAKKDLRRDYEKYLYQPSIMQQYNINFSGGSKNMNYLLGLNYDNSRSNLVGNEEYRANINTRVNIRLLRNLELQTGLVYTIAHDAYNGFNAVQASAFKPNLYPYAQLADAAGNALPVVKEYRSSYTDTAGAGRLLDWTYRPLDEQRLADNRINRHDVQLSLGLRYEFTKSLSAEFLTQWQQSNSESAYKYDRESYYARNEVNRFTNTGAGNTIIRNIPAGGILDNQNSDLLSGAVRAQLNYNSNIGKDLELSALAGFEAREAKAESSSGRIYGWDKERLSFANVDYTRLYNLWEAMGSDYIYSSMGFAKTTNRYVSYFGNTSFTYRERYLLSASIRKDASNLFGVNTNQKWNPFWSLGAAWKISEEKFYGGRAFPKLSVRLTYGYSGNIIPGQSALPVLSYSSNSVIPLPYASVNNAANPNLRWEQTRTINMGLDWALKKEKLWGSLDVYTKRSTDLFAAIPLDPTIGVRTQVLNAANLISHGFNLKLSVLPVNKTLKWQVDLLVDHVINKVTKSFNESANKGVYAGFGTGITALEGKDPYAMISYRWAGLDPLTGAPRGNVGDTISKDYGLLTKPSSFSDMVISGSTRPKFYGSIRNGFSYRSFSLSFNISYAFAYYFRRSGINYSVLYAQWGMNSEFAQRWQQPGDEARTNVPSMFYPVDSRRDAFYNYSEATVEKADHIRLKDIQVQYKPATASSHSALLKNMELTLYLNNIGILWRANAKKLDPVFGLNNPTPLNVSLGLKTNF